MMHSDSDFRKWLKLFGKLACKLAFLITWLLTTWSVQEYIVKRFPLDGTAKLVEYTMEVAFSVSILIELLKLLFAWNRNSKNIPWWR